MEPRRPPRGRPRSEPLEVQRDRVVGAARSLFADRGYDATTVAAVATAASVARSVVYEVVGDKLALLEAVVDQVAMEIVAGFVDRFDTGSRPENAREMVRGVLEWFVTAVRTDPSIGSIVRLSRLLDLPGAGDAPDVGRAGRARGQIEDGLTALHLRMFPPGHTTSAHSARLLSAAVVAMTEAVTFRAVEGDWPVDETVDLLTEMLLGIYRVTGTRAGDEAVIALNRAAEAAEGPAGRSSAR